MRSARTTKGLQLLIGGQAVGLKPPRRGSLIHVISARYAESTREELPCLNQSEP